MCLALIPRQNKAMIKEWSKLSVTMNIQKIGTPKKHRKKTVGGDGLFLLRRLLRHLAYQVTLGKQLRCQCRKYSITTQKQKCHLETCDSITKKNMTEIIFTRKCRASPPSLCNLISNLLGRPNIFVGSGTIKKYKVVSTLFFSGQGLHAF